MQSLSSPAPSLKTVRRRAQTKFVVNVVWAIEIIDFEPIPVHCFGPIHLVPNLLVSCLGTCLSYLSLCPWRLSQHRRVAAQPHPGAASLFKFFHRATEYLPPLCGGPVMYGDEARSPLSGRCFSDRNFGDEGYEMARL